MNREDIVKELNHYVKKINERFEASTSLGDLNLYVNGVICACFVNFKKHEFEIDDTARNTAILIAKTGIINKFYKKGVELLKKTEKKYTIKIFKNEYGFLYKRESDDYSNLITDELTNYNNRTYFTKSEIEKLKQRQDIAIDWDKAIIKEADD